MRDVVDEAAGELDVAVLSEPAWRCVVTSMDQQEQVGDYQHLGSDHQQTAASWLLPALVCGACGGGAPGMVFVRPVEKLLCPGCLSTYAARNRTTPEAKLLPLCSVRPLTEAGGRVPALPGQP